MSAYDDMLTAMQEMATDAHHACANDGYRGETYEYPPDEVHERLSVHVHALLEEVAQRLDSLGERETSGSQTFAKDRMRALSWALAAEEVRSFARNDFIFEIVDDEPREVFSTPEEFCAPLDSIGAQSPLTPDFAYDKETGTVVPLSARAKYGTRSTRGYRHTQWAFGPPLPNDHSALDRAMFGSNVYTMRKTKGCKRAQLAVAIGETKKTVRKIEYGELSHDWDGTLITRSSYLVERIAWMMGSTVDELWPHD